MTQSFHSSYSKPPLCHTRPKFNTDNLQRRLLPTIVDVAISVLYSTLVVSNSGGWWGQALEQNNSNAGFWLLLIVLFAVTLADDHRSVAGLMRRSCQGMVTRGATWEQGEQCCWYCCIAVAGVKLCWHGLYKLSQKTEASLLASRPY